MMYNQQRFKRARIYTSLSNFPNFVPNHSMLQHNIFLYRKHCTRFYIGGKNNAHNLGEKIVGFLAASGNSRKTTISLLVRVCLFV